LRHTVKFEPGDPPRTGQVAFCAPEGTRSVPIGDAVPLLLGATQPPTSASAHPTAAFWAAVTVAALRLIEQGRVLPGDVDTWQVGPLEPAEFDWIRDLAAAMPAGATAPAQTEMPEAAVRQFFDAIADWITRTPATASSGVRISLRLEHAEPTNEFRAVVQVHSLAEPSLVADAAALWAGADLRFGATARADTLLAVRRAARVWPVLDRLLDNAVPDELALADDEVGELLGAMTGHLARGRCRGALAPRAGA
jgi:hypothetical protein